MLLTNNGALTIDAGAVSSTDVVRQGGIAVRASTGAVYVSGNVPSVLAQSAIPFILPSSGSIGNNGALTGITALPTTYSGGCWMYFPANAIVAGSTAGWYWTVMGSTTAGTIYNSTYTSGTNFVGTATAFATTGPGAYTQTTATDIQGPIITIPGGALGPNGQLHVTTGWGANNAAGNRTARVRIGTTTLWAVNLVSMAGYGQYGVIANTNSQSAQVIHYSNQGLIGTAGSVGYLTTNTASNWQINFSLLLPAATDFLALNQFDLRVQYGA